MAKFLIDVNLPYYFGLWNSPDYVHQIDIDPSLRDKEIWHYAIENGLTIITKDSDFTNRALLSKKAPKIIQVRFGNLKMRDFFKVIHSCWDKVLELSDENRIVMVYSDKIEAIA